MKTVEISYLNRKPVLGDIMRFDSDSRPYLFVRLDNMGFDQWYKDVFYQEFWKPVKLTTELGGNDVVYPPEEGKKTFTEDALNIFLDEMSKKDLLNNSKFS